MAGVTGLALGVNTGGVCLHRAWQSLSKPNSLRKPAPAMRVTVMCNMSSNPRAAIKQHRENALAQALRSCAVCLATAVAIALPLLPLPSGIAVEAAEPAPTTLVEAPTPSKDVGTLLRDALPVHNAAIRDIQKSVEGIADCFNLPPEEAVANITLNSRKAALVLDQNKDSLLGEIPDQKRVMGQLLVEELNVGVTDCNKLAEENNLDAVAAKHKDLLQIVSKLEEFMVNKFPFDIPEEYATKPLLKGRATIEMSVRLKNRPNGNGNGKSNIVKIVVDGYNAPLTAGNFVDLVARRFYDGMAIQKADGFIVQTGDPRGAADGFVEPGTGKVRTIPLEIMVEGDSAPIYGATLEELGRDQDKTKLPFNSCSTLAMARKDKEKNSASSQIFWLLKDCQEKNSSSSDESAAAKEVMLQVKDPVEGYSSAIELSTTDPTVEDKKETVTKEINISRSILDGVAADSDKVVAATEASQAETTDSSSSSQTAGDEQPGDLQESEVVKVEDLKRSNGTTKDGQYAVFGYVVENQALLGKLQVGDVIESMRVVSGIDNLDIGDMLEEEDNDGGITSQSSLPASESHLKAENLAQSSEQVLNEEEDEEVIVFKPLTKDKPPASEPLDSSHSDNFVPPFNFLTVPTTSEVSVQTISMPSIAGKNPWLPEAVSNVQAGSVASKFQSPFQLTSGLVQYSSVEGKYPLDPKTVVSSSKSGLVELATPMPLISVTGSSAGLTPMVHDAAAGISTLHLSGMNSLGNEVSVTRSRDFPVLTSPVTSSATWLDQYTDTPQYVSSSTDVWFQGQKGVFKNFPEKRMGAGSVVTSQSQNNSLWSSEREPMDRSGVSGFVPSATPNDRFNGEMLPNSSSLPLLTLSELSSGFESGKFSVGSNRDATAIASSGWNMKDLPVPTRVSQPAMRPPPGFGPLPGKSTAKPSLNTAQGIFQPPSTFQSQKPNIGEDNVDDYGWLDDFRSVKPVSPQSGYSGDRESQPSRNLWSVGDGISRSAGFDSAPFPFPGMGASHHRKFNTSVAPHTQAQSPYSESQLTYTERQKPVDEAQVQAKAQAELRQLQQQQLMFLQRQQQQYQQQMPGQYHSRDPFVS